MDRDRIIGKLNIELKLGAGFAEEIADTICKEDKDA